LAVKVVVLPEKCTLSGECMKVCPLGAISVRDGKAFIDQDKCDGDGICLPACPNAAIRVVDED